MRQFQWKLAKLGLSLTIWTNQGPTIWFKTRSLRRLWRQQERYIFAYQMSQTNYFCTPRTWAFILEHSIAVLTIHLTSVDKGSFSACLFPTKMASRDLCFANRRATRVCYHVTRIFEPRTKTKGPWSGPKKGPYPRTSQMDSRSV